MSQTEKKYNESITSLYEKKSGNLMSMPVDDYVMDKLKHVKPGGKLMVRYLTEEQRAAFAARKGKTVHTYQTPAAFIDVISPEEAAKFDAEMAAKAQAQGI